MDQKKTAPKSELTRQELRNVYTSAGETEQKLMRELVNSDFPSQGAIVAEILHYFPGAHLEECPKLQ